MTSQGDMKVWHFLWKRKCSVSSEERVHATEWGRLAWKMQTQFEKVIMWYIKFPSSYPHILRSRHSFLDWIVTWWIVSITKVTGVVNHHEKKWWWPGQQSRRKQKRAWKEAGWREEDQTLPQTELSNVPIWI